jgi:lysozyme family protein
VTTDQIIDGVIGREGRYSNDPHDTGGETMWGITVGVARKNGYDGSMRDMPREFAVTIYRKRYIEEPGFADIAKRSERIAEELVDTGVNMGPAVAAMFLQRALNALNRGGSDYPDILVDGDIGHGTLSALQCYLKLRRDGGEDVMLKALNALQGERYIDLAEKRTANENFLFGWLRTRVA